MSNYKEGRMATIKGDKPRMLSKSPTGSKHSRMPSTDF